MGRRCKVCDDPERASIDAALLQEPHRNVAKRFGISPAAAYRHLQHHLAADISAARQQPSKDIRNLIAVEHVTQQRQRRGDLFETWRELRDRCFGILDAAEQDPDRALKAIRELRGLLDLPLRHAAELRGANSDAAGLHEHRDWPNFIGTVLNALDQHPAARDALVRALEAGESNR